MTNSTQDNPNPYAKYLKPKYLAPVVVVVLLIGVFSVWSYRKGVGNQGERMQERIETAHRNAQTELSKCLDQGRVGAQVAQQEFDQIKGILVDTASARYVDKDGNPTNAAESIGGGQLFSVVQEAYPSIDQSTFQDLMGVVVGCRDGFANEQKRLFHEINDFNTWVQQDNVWNQGIKNNFPTKTLTALDYASGKTLKGQDALDYMSRVILVKDARDSYATGDQTDQDLFGDGKGGGN